VAAGSLILAVAQFLLGNFIFKWPDAVSNAAVLGLTLLVCCGAAALWTRRQARRGRRTRWLANPGK
jgi:hypothetical protein